MRKDRQNSKLKERSKFGEIIRALSPVFKTVDEWKPVYAAVNTSGRTWFMDGINRGEFLCSEIFDKNQIIQLFIDYYGHKSYLEIGGQPSDIKSTFNSIRCNTKHAIDPEEKQNADFTMTSDDFFEKHGGERKYGAVFIDGWHEHQQVYRDITNSLDNLEDNGVIILHDMIPITSDLEKDPHRTGTCWRAFADLRKRDDVTMATLVPPWGSEDSLGIIMKGKQNPLDGEVEYSYDFLIENMENIMQTIDLPCFFEIFFPYINFKLQENPNGELSVGMSMDPRWEKEYGEST